MIQLVRYVRHSQILFQIVSLLQNKSRICIEMNVFILKICEYEYGDNTLQQAIKERKIEFNEEECFQLFVQIVCGVLYIHKKKIIHRNIKPSNIVVTKQNIVKISDFGVSCVMDISSNSHTNIGTPHYMSPE